MIVVPVLWSGRSLQPDVVIVARFCTKNKHPDAHRTLGGSSCPKWCQGKLFIRSVWVANDITGVKPTSNDDLASDSARVEDVFRMSI